MCWKIFILFVALLTKEINGVIYHLNESEFNLMPPIHKLDDYEACLKEHGYVYCTVDFNLVSDNESELLNMIQEYSEQTITHYNHSQLTYGICVLQRCQKHVQDRKLVSKTTIEACLNDTFMKEYSLSTQVTDFNCYSTSDAKEEFDTADQAVAIVLLVILMLNVIGSVYDLRNQENIRDNNFLLCFSIPRNWKRLISCKSNPDLGLEYLKGLNGIRCFIIFGVIMVHSTWPFTRAVENVHDMELTYYNLRQNIIMTGSLVIQLNMLISGFLLAHNIEIYCENHDIGWYIIPKGIIVRYFRITPVYAVVIAVCATWLKLLAPGPLWQVSGYLVYSHCRSDWWKNLLYINNYNYNTQCLMHAWDHFMRDTEEKKLRKTVLTSVLLLGIVSVAVHTYVRDLDPILILAPEPVKKLFEVDPTFNETYRMGHTNIPSFIIGMMLGYYVYSNPKTGVDVSKHRKLRYMYWAIAPLGAAIMFSGEYFYRDAPRDPLALRVIYAAISKPLFSYLMAMLILGTIYKIDNVYRKVLEWDMWRIPSRLTYCVFIVHMILLQLYVGLSHTLITFSSMNLFLLAVVVTVVSLIASVPLWLLVETPFTLFVKYYFSGTQQKKTN